MAAEDKKQLLTFFYHSLAIISQNWRKTQYNKFSSGALRTLHDIHLQKSYVHRDRAIKHRGREAFNPFSYFAISGIVFSR